MVGGGLVATSGGAHPTPLASSASLSWAVCGSRYCRGVDTILPTRSSPPRRPAGAAAGLIEILATRGVRRRVSPRGAVLAHGTCFCRYSSLVTFWKTRLDRVQRPYSHAIRTGIAAEASILPETDPIAPVHVVFGSQRRFTAASICVHERAACR